MGKKWLEAGDSNTKFFHQFANGRRRKGTIMQLETDSGIVTEQQDIMAHAVQFYKNLFGPVESRHIFLSDSFWVHSRKVRDKDHEQLVKQFSVAEIKHAIFYMKKDAAPGPNGFGVVFS
jgi:hypothetical protein